MIALADTLWNGEESWFVSRKVIKGQTFLSFPPNGGGGGCLLLLKLSLLFTALSDGDSQGEWHLPQHVL